jgi:hypothetical protein
MNQHYQQHPAAARGPFAHCNGEHAHHVQEQQQQHQTQYHHQQQQQSGYQQVREKSPADAMTDYAR